MIGMRLFLRFIAVEPQIQIGDESIGNNDDE
jgi:hypothetical protein